MKKPLNILLFIFFLGLVFYGCNEEQTPIQPESNNSQQFYKGTETLGDPEIEIAEGSGYIIAGTGLVADQTGTIDISSIPSGAEVKQVLLYWSGGFDSDVRQNGDNTLEINGTEVTGETIGGTTLFYQSAVGEQVTFESFRADITTDYGFDWTALNSLSVTGMDNGNLSGPQTYNENDGAGVFVVYDDGSPAEIQLLDGQDLAYKYFGGALKVTVPQTFNFTASDVDRPASLGFFAGSVAINRPNVTRVTINGNPEDTFDLFGSNDGADWDSPVLPIVIPAGTENVTVELISDEHGITGVLPASLLWVTAALSIDEPQEDPGCTRTQGYWKTHSFYGPAPYDPTWENLLNDPYTNLGDYKDFFLSGQSYYDVMWFKARGNAYYKLAIQYVAAILNDYANAEVPSDVAQMISDAEDLFNTYTPNDIKGLKGDNPIRQQFIDLGDGLDAYNNGYLGVPHCDDGDDYGSIKGKKKK